MAQDINLLPDQTPQDKQQARNTQMVTWVSMIFLGGTLVIVLGLFIANTVVSSQISSAKDQISQQEQRILAKKTEEGIQIAINKKVEHLTTFFKGQKSYSGFLTKFSQTVPDGVRLTDLGIDPTNKVTFSGKATSYADLAGFYDKLRTAGAAKDGDTGTYFTNPQLSSISYDRGTGQITFSMNFTASAAVLEMPAL